MLLLEDTRRMFTWCQNWWTSLSPPCTSPHLRLTSPSYQRSRPSTWGSPRQGPLSQTTTDIEEKQFEVFKSPCGKGTNFIEFLRDDKKLRKVKPINKWYFIFVHCFINIFRNYSITFIEIEILEKLSHQHYSILSTLGARDSRCLDNSPTDHWMSPGSRSGWRTRLRSRHQSWCSLIWWCCPRWRETHRALLIQNPGF